MNARPELPTGTVTFVFTDIEGSTRLLRDLGNDAYAGALAEHRRVVRGAIVRHGGVEIDTQGDSFFIAFDDADAAVRAAREVLESLAEGKVRVRIGIHTGSAQLAGDGYVGRDVHLGARIAAAGHGGQVVLSKASVTSLRNATSMTDLGEHRVKDFDEPIWIYQLGTAHFAPLRTISNTNLPRPTSSFVGRETELAAIVELLRNSARQVTLTGPGGTGKTRLAIEAATELLPAFRNGVFWVPLASLNDHRLVLGQVAEVVGANEDLASYIGEREMLLLLDNFEQVVDSAPDVAALVASCTNLRVLVTSRERLRVSGETEVAVPPLARPEAIQLFTARSGLPADATVDELCRRLDDLPLAVELAAARASVMTPRQMLDRIGARLDLLKGSRDAVARQATLRATIEWSFDLLGSSEQQLFASLAVFKGGWTLDQAEAISDADIDNLQSLADKSLVRHGGVRFWMLETIREFAAERLAKLPLAEALSDRHALYFLSLAEEAEPRLIGPDADSWHERLSRDHDNLRAALDRFELSGDHQRAMALAGALAEFWDQRAHHVEGLHRYRSLLHLDATPTPARAKALHGASLLASKSNDPEAAVRWGEEALALYRRFGDTHGMALELWGLGYSRVEAGDYSAAQKLLRESVDLLQEVGDDVSAAWATRTLAFSYYKPGDHERARPLYEEALMRARQVGDQGLEAHALGPLSEYAIDDGRLLDAAILARQTLRIVATAGDPLLVHSRLCGIARVLISLDRPNIATRLISYAEARYEEIGAQESWVAAENRNALKLIHEVLDDTVFDEEWEQGRKLSPEAAMTLAGDEIEEAVERNRVC